MAPHLLFIAPPATLLTTETRSSNDPLSRRHWLCASVRRRTPPTNRRDRCARRRDKTASCWCSISLEEHLGPSGASSVVFGTSVGAIAISAQRRSWVVASSPFLEPELRSVGSQRLEACHQFFLGSPQPFLQAVQQSQFSDRRWSRGFVVPRGFDTRL